MATSTLDAAPSGGGIPHREAPAFMNPYLAGVGLGLVLLSAFVLMGRGLGASGAFTATLTWLMNLLAPDHARANEFLSPYLESHPLKEWLVFELLGLSVGVFISGMLARRVKLSVEKGPRIGTGPRLLLAFVGGAVLAVGAHLARGCMSGQALTGGALLNLGSWAAMMCIFAGAYATAHFVRRQWR